MMTSDEIARSSFSTRLVKSFSRIAAMYLDKTTVHPTARWAVTLFLIVLYVIRVYFAQGFYVVTYGLGIYMLHLLIGFLSPQLDTETDSYVLPVRDSEEYRPFQRRVPEFKFWWSLTKALILCSILTIFRIFDLPVFWPILLAYFIILLALTLKRQLNHMIKHRYVPVSWGKQSYGDITRSAPAGAGGGSSVPTLSSGNPSGSDNAISTIQGSSSTNPYAHQQPTAPATVSVTAAVLPPPGSYHNTHPPHGGVRGVTAPNRVHRL